MYVCMCFCHAFSLYILLKVYWAMILNFWLWAFLTLFFHFRMFHKDCIAGRYSYNVFFCSNATDFLYIFYWKCFELWFWIFGYRLFWHCSSKSESFMKIRYLEGIATMYFCSIILLLLFFIFSIESVFSYDSEFLATGFFDIVLQNPKVSWKSDSWKV